MPQEAVAAVAMLQEEQPLEAPLPPLLALAPLGEV